MYYTHEIPYRPILQRAYCCVPATLQWIFYRKNIDILEQEYIGAELGLRLPSAQQHKYSDRKIRFMDRPPKNGYGTQIEKAQYSISKFLIKNNIPLEISDLIHINSKSSVRMLLIDNFLAQNDIIVRYNTGIWSANLDKKYGHFSVIVSFDSKSDVVIIGNPETPHFRSVTIDDLILATSPKYDGIKRGFYIVSLANKP